MHIEKKVINHLHFNIEILIVDWEVEAENKYEKELMKKYKSHAVFYNSNFM